MKRRLFTLCLLAFLGYQANAQWMLGFHGVYNTPLNQLNNRGYRQGWGGSWEVLTPSLIRQGNEMGLRFGAQLDFTFHGRVRNDITLQTPNNDPGTLTLKNSSLFYGIYAKYSPVSLYDGKVFPYADLIMAGRLFDTEEVIRSKEHIEGYQNETHTNKLTSRTFSPGLALGAAWAFSDHVWLDAKVGYDFGDKINFAYLGSVRKSGNEVLFDSRSAKNDALWVKVGVLIRLMKNNNDEPTDDYRRSDSIISSPRSAPEKPLMLKPNPPKPIDY